MMMMMMMMMMMIRRYHIHEVFLRLANSLLHWNLEMLVFEERGKSEYRRKTFWSKGKNQQQTRPTYGVDAAI